MSIEKDVEKKYIDDLERQNKKLKKRKKKRLLALLLILLLLGSIGLMLGLMGLLPGMGDDGSGSGDSKSSSASSAADSSSEAETTTTTAVPAVYDDVKVSGSTYIYQSQVKTLEEIKTIISNMKENVVIRITDDNATKNAMDNLTNMLSDSKRSYSLTSVETKSSDTSSSQDEQSSSEKETTTTKE